MKRLPWLLIVIILLVACRPAINQTDSSPLNELPGGSQGPYTSDITNESVLIKFNTSEPTVCNVTYGLDAQYGSTASNMMMGGAARRHEITLDSLMPNTTYHYRLNITDKQGNLYQSEDLTFTTQVATANTDETEKANIASLAAGASVVRVSSNYAGGDNDSNFGANNAIDGRTTSQWSSDGDGDNAWIEIQLPGEYDITEIGFWTRTMSNNTATIFSFTVTTDRGEIFGPFELPDKSQLYTFPVSFTASVLRFDAVKTNSGNTGAVEISAYGTLHTQ